MKNKKGTILDDFAPLTGASGDKWWRIFRYFQEYLDQSLFLKRASSVRLVDKIKLKKVFSNSEMVHIWIYPLKRKSSVVAF